MSQCWFSSSQKLMFSCQLKSKYNFHVKQPPSHKVTVCWLKQKRAEFHSHVSFVVVANLLDTNVILCIDEGLRRGVSLGQCHNTGNILKIVLIVHFYLGQQSKYKYTSMYLGPRNIVFALNCGNTAILPFPFLSEHGPSLPPQGSEGR